MKKERIIGISGNLGSGKDTVADYLIDHHAYVRIALADPLKRLGSSVFLFSYNQLWGPSQMRNAHDTRYFAGSPAWKNAAVRLVAVADRWLEPIFKLYPDLDIMAVKQSLLSWFDDLESNYPDLSPRIMLQALGTEWGRDSVDEDVWISLVLDTAKQLLHTRWNGTMADEGRATLRYDPAHGLRETHDSEHVQGVVISDVRFQNEFAAIRDKHGTLVKVLREATDAEAASIGIPQHASETQDFPLSEFHFILRNDGTLAQLEHNIDIFLKVL